MGKRGPKPKGTANPVWSANLAYAVGLLVTDGSLSKDGRHIVLVSKDMELLENLKTALKLKTSIGYTTSNYNSKRYGRIQVGDVLLYQFLLGIGLMPNKTKIIGAVKISDEYFFDFLRGHFDGDGCTHSYFDPRWKSSFMFYTIFLSASMEHILWLQEEIFSRLGVRGHITGKGKVRTAYQLKYAKADSLKILRNMYPSKKVLCLSRKRLKIEEMLRIIGERLYVL